MASMELVKSWKNCVNVLPTRPANFRPVHLDIAAANQKIQFFETTVRGGWPFGPSPLALKV